MPIGTTPSCVGKNYTGHWFEPDSDSGDFASQEGYWPGDTINITWFGGTMPSSSFTSQSFRLFLQSYKSPYSGTNLTIMEPKYFQAMGADGSWTSNGDACANTEMRYEWAIPYDLNVTNADDRYVFVAQNETTSDYSTTTSPAFFLRVHATNTTTNTATSTAPASKAASTESTRASDTSTPQSSSSPAATEQPSPGLGTGAIVGIVVSCTVIGLLVLAGFLLFFRRRRPEPKIGADGEFTPATFEKPELDGSSVLKQPSELYDEHVADLKGQGKASEPVELMGS